MTASWNLSVASSGVRRFGHRDDAINGGKLIYTLPLTLLKLIDQCFSKKGIKSERWDREIKWARLASQQANAVGFWCNGLLHCHLLQRSEPHPVDEETAKCFGNLPAGVINGMLRLANDKLARIVANAKAYAGWLMTSTAFVSEHDELMTRFRHEIEEFGLPLLSRVTTGAVNSAGLAKFNDELKRFFESFDAFYLRWRLSGLVGPYLPLPLAPQTPVLSPLLALGPQNQVGSLFFVPDTYPVPSREALIGLLEPALQQGQANTHLSEWKKMISSKNPAKNKLERYAQLFELQHYCRILQQRHRDALNGRRDKLEEAFAGLWRSSESKVHADFILVKKRLGADWMSRQCGFEFVE